MAEIDPGVPARLPAAINRPLSLGGRVIDNRLALAPMTFLGHVAFRELVSEFGGCGLLWTEMCNSRLVPTENPRVSAYFRWRKEELSFLVCQIFGADPSQMAEAARRIEAEGFFGVDINFGCSVASICRQRCGAALLNTPSLAVQIVEKVRQAVGIPLFVKFRTGWRDDPAEAVELARRFEQSGADALVFHPRVAPDRRSRPPRWEYIGRVKAAVSVPVFGNGNVFTPEDCLQMMKTTGCDAVALGRMAVVRPWVFAQWASGLLPDGEIYKQSALRLAGLLEAHFPPAQAIRRYRKFAMYFSANFRFGHTLFKWLQGASTMEEVRDAISRFFDCAPDLNKLPNLNFLI